MGLIIEMVLAKLLNRLTDSAIVKKHCAEHALFGLTIVRRHF